MLKRIFLVLFYCCYGLVLVGVLLVVFFPKDRFLVWVAKRVEEKLPGYECRIEEVRYVHPFKLGLYQIVLDNPAERISIPIDALQVGIERKWPVQTIRVSAVLFGGTVETDVAVQGQDEPLELNNLAAVAVRLEEIDFLHTRLDRQILGICNMSGNLRIGGENRPAVYFDGVIEVESFFTKLRRPVLSFSEIDLAAITAEVRIGPEKIDLVSGRYRGELLRGEFAGVITVRKPWQLSRLDLTGGIIPDDRLVESDPQLTESFAGLYREYRQEAIPCLIEGTVQEPQFRFGRE